VNVELIGALARIRREELLAEAHIYRRLKAADAARRGRSMRTTLARAVRAFGYAALSLGDALAESR
jgi:hypothetical protein